MGYAAMWMWAPPIGVALFLIVLMAGFALRRVGREVAERKRAEEELLNKEAQLHTALDNMPSAFLVLNANLELILFNRKYLEMFALPKELVSPGTHISVPIRHVAERGGYGKGNVGQIVDHRVTELRNALSDPTLATKELSLLDDKFVSAQYALSPQGFLVGVISDITKQIEDGQDLEKAYDIIKDAYDLSKEQKERMEKELNVGHDIQMSMIPLEFPTISDHPEFSIFATMKPAREVGGDFYDFFFIDEERLCFCVGDVSGKGVPSALFMAVAKALIKSRAADDFSTAGILTHVNNELSADNKSTMFVTVFLGILHIRTGDLLITNGGHNPPYIKKHGGELQCLNQIHGPIVGAFKDMDYEEQTLHMESGDLLFIFSDGVTEAINRNGEMFSETGLEQCLTGMQESHPEGVIANTMETVKTFAKRTEQSDDITMLAIQFFGQQKK